MVEQKWYCLLIKGRLTGQRSCAGDTGVQFAQIQFTTLLIQEKVEAEIAPIAFAFELLADGHSGLLRLLTKLCGKSRGGATEDFIATPATSVGRQFFKANQRGHQWPNQDAVLGDTAFNGCLAAANPPHNLDSRLGGDLQGIRTEIRLCGNEIGGIA